MVNHRNKAQREEKQLVEMVKFFKKNKVIAGGMHIKATGISGLNVPHEIQYENVKFKN